MSLDRKRLLRELWAERAQSIAVATVIGLGVALFLVSAAAYQDLRDSYSSTRSKLALASIQVDLPEANEEAQHRAQKVDGVERVEPRLSIELPVVAHGERATLRVVSLPAGGAQPQLDRLLVVSGRLPEHEGQIAVEKHFAVHQGLKEGSTVPLASGAGSLTVTAVVVSAEYLWVAKDESDFMPSPARFGVAWATRDTQREIARQLLASGSLALAPASLRAAASGSAGNQLLVQLSKGATPSTAAAQLQQALGPGARATEANEQVGVKLMQMDLDGYRGMAAFFPFFFLGVGAFIVGSAIARRVDAQRQLSGTLMALGVSRARVLWGHLSYGLLLSGGGALLGAALGQLGAPAVTASYAEELGIPFVEWRLHPLLWAAGIAMGLLVGAAASLPASLHAMRLNPSEAMRAPRVELGLLARAARKLPLPLPLKLALRDLLGRPLRSFGTALGISSAVVLVLSTGVLADAMKTTFHTLFDLAQRYDDRVDFAAPRPGAEALARAHQVAGVGRVEGLLVLPVRLEANGRSVDALLESAAAGSTLDRVLDADGSDAAPRPGGLSLTRAAAAKLKLKLGETVQVSSPGLAPLGLKLSAFADAAMGNRAAVRREDVDAAWGLTGQIDSVLVTAKDPEAARRALTEAFPGAPRVENAAAARAQFQQLMGLGWLMVGLMLGFGGVLAGAILFNTATLTVLEHQRDLSTRRALGQTMREVAAQVTFEHAVLTALGCLLGLPLALACGKAMLSAFDSELFSLPFVVEPSTVAVTLVGVVVVVLLAQWPALRRVARLDLAEAVRVREG